MEATGAALASVWGGPRKQLYYTPTGEEIWAIPSIRDWVQKDAGGKVVAQGERDANFDKGWLTSPPTELKITCPACSFWHDTDDEVQDCVKVKAVFAKKWDKKAHHLTKNGTGDGGEAVEALNGRVESLEGKLDSIESLLKQLVGGTS